MDAWRVQAIGQLGGVSKKVRSLGWGGVEGDGMVVDEASFMDVISWVGRICRAGELMVGSVVGVAA